MLRRLRKAIAGHPLALAHLITHEVDPADRDWFDGSRVAHLRSVPGREFELLRTAFLLLISGPMPLPVVMLVLLGNAVVVGWVDRLQSANRQPKGPRWAGRELQAWRIFILARSVLLSLTLTLCITFAPPDRLVPLAMYYMAVQSIELFGQFTLPLAGLISGCISLAVAGVAMAYRPEVNGAIVSCLVLLQLFNLHPQVFNLNYMFATRRLRTHKLKSANETIQLLLDQYDEHGSDCLVEADREGRIRKPSERLCVLTGRLYSELDGLKISELSALPTEREAMRRAAHRLQPFRDLSVPAILPATGEMRWWTLSGCPTFDSSGNHTGFRGFLRDATARQLAEGKVRFLAHHDPLTGLANRATFNAHTAERLMDTTRPNQVAVLFIDLDHFKVVNDTHGHLVGDKVLTEAGNRLKQGLAPADLVARLGGDEFAILLDEAHSSEAVLHRAEAMIERLTAPMMVEGHSFQIGCCIGVALAPDHGLTGDALLRAADIALYEAKASGRGAATLFDQSMQKELQDRRALKLDLRKAIANNEFMLHYQPFHMIEGERLVGFEALLRWNHPERGLIDPGTFIPIAEQTGLIVPIGEWVLRAALTEAATWPEDLIVAVNVSAVQMRGGELLRQVVSALSWTGFDPARLELEITETMLLQDQEQAYRILHRLRELGVRIALDDFGTGYSSLNYLRSFPFDKIKIDRCFIEDLVNGDGSSAIVEAVLALAGRLNMQTIAEGVEDPAQLQGLRERGCEQVQGYLTGRAIPAEELPITRRSKPEPVIELQQIVSELVPGKTEPMPAPRRKSRSNKRRLAG